MFRPKTTNDLLKTKNKKSKFSLVKFDPKVLLRDAKSIRRGSVSSSNVAVYSKENQFKASKLSDSKLYCSYET